MLKEISRRVFLGGAVTALGTIVQAGAPAVSLRPKARPGGNRAPNAPAAAALIDEARLGGDVSFSVIDVKTGLLLEGYEARSGLPPASVTKAVTALYALDVLGPGYRFETRLVATGPMRNGVIEGDLVLAGGGDPVLDTNALADLAAGLKSAGVREVRGRFRTWGGALPFARVVDADQPEHVGYNPSVSGLNLNFNRVHFEWRRSGNGYSVAMDARSDKYRPAVRVARMSVADRRAPVYTYRDGGDHDSWSVARGALGNGGSRWLPVRRPEAYAAEVFAGFARSHGIVLRYAGAAGTAPGGTVVARHRSAPLTDLLRDMLKYSNNLMAEAIGMTASARRKGRPVDLAASGREMSQWARRSLEMQGASLVDHSGLGVDSRLSASAMAGALARVHRSGQLKPILKPIAMKDANGRVTKSHPVKVTAKTGTLYFVSALAGYATAEDGTELAFAIFTANTRRRGAINSKQAERPEGSVGWNRRAKRLQQRLIERWSKVYGS